MILTLREEPNNPEYLRKTLSLLASICIHAAVIGCAFWLSSLPDGAWNYRQARQVVRIEPSRKEHKVIWLRRNERLPRISPTVRQDGAGTKTQAPDKLFVLANPPKAKHWDQFVYVPVPKAEEQAPIPSPSVVMTTAPNPVPPKPEPRKFVPPSDRPQDAKPREVVLQEPTALRAGLDMKAPAGLSKMDAPKPESKRFVPPPDPQRKVSQSLVDLPEGLPVQPANVSAIKLAIPAGQPDAPRPPGRKFTPPSDLAGGGGAGGARGSASAGQAVAVPDVGSAPIQNGVPGPISAVIISAFPSSNANITPPEGNRLSKIQSGTMPGGDRGNGSEPNGSDGLVIPGVTVRGGTGSGTGGAMAANRTPAPLAASAVTPTPIPAIRPRLDTPSVSVPQRPNSRRVPQQVEGVFQNRVVYCTVMPGPTGVPDWVVWFGEVDLLPPGSRSVVRPPVATKTTLPSGNAGGPVDGKLWISARLGRSGKLSAVNITGGLGARQTQDLASEMEKWVFTPAIRNGEAVDVDLVLEARLPIDRSKP